MGLSPLSVQTAAGKQTELHSEAQPITQSEIVEEKVEHNQSNAGF